MNMRLDPASNVPSFFETLQFQPRPDFEYPPGYINNAQAANGRCAVMLCCWVQVSVHTLLSPRESCAQLPHDRVFLPGGNRLKKSFLFPQA